MNCLLFGFTFSHKGRAMLERRHNPLEVKSSKSRAAQTLGPVTLRVHLPRQENQAAASYEALAVVR